MTETGWKLIKVKKIGSTLFFLAETGKNGFWPIRYGRKHFLPPLHFGIPRNDRKGTGVLMDIEYHKNQLSQLRYPRRKCVLTGTR